MNGEVLRFLFALVTLVVGAGFEELLPKFGGVGFPVLMVATSIFALVAARADTIVFALAAGAFVDALSSLPFMTSASFFMVMALVVRRVRQPLLALAAFPLYQLWLALWAGLPSGGLALRLLLAVPVGGLTAAAVGTLLWWLWHTAALSEAD